MSGEQLDVHLFDHLCQEAVTHTTQTWAQDCELTNQKIQELVHAQEQLLGELKEIEKTIKTCRKPCLYTALREAGERILLQMFQSLAPSIANHLHGVTFRQWTTTVQDEYKTLYSFRVVLVGVLDKPCAVSIPWSKVDLHPHEQMKGVLTLLNCAACVLTANHDHFSAFCDKFFK